jgi:hypothetical protein
MTASYCVRLLSDEHPPADPQNCCCADADACFEAIDEATVLLQDAGLPLRERVRRLARGSALHVGDDPPQAVEVPV